MLASSLGWVRYRKYGRLWGFTIHAQAIRLGALASLLAGACSLVVDGTYELQLGASCNIDEHCASGECLENVCTQLCDVTRPCPGKLTCESNGYCFPVLGPIEGDLQVGFLYPGPLGDFGWTYAHNQARLQVERDLDFIKTRYIPDVSTANAAAHIQDLIASGSHVVVATSYDFLAPIQNAAHNNPDVRFLINAGFVSGPNLGSYFGRMYQAYYLSGQVAGYATTTNTVGFVAPVPIPLAVRLVNAFALGVRRANPTAQVMVAWVDDWHNIALETESTVALYTKGADVIATATDTRVVSEVVDKINRQGATTPVYSIGDDNADACGRYADSCLTAPYWNWAPLYRRFFEQIRAGTWDPQENPWVQIQQNPTNSVVYLADIKAGPLTSLEILSVEKQRTSLARTDPRTRMMPFVGPVRDNRGVPVLGPGEYLIDEELLRMCWFVQGVVNLAGTPAVVPVRCDADREPPTW